MAYVNKDVWVDETLCTNAVGSYNTSIPNAITPVITENRTVSLAASGIVNATPATAFTALITALKTAIDTLITTTWGVDTSTKTVSYSAKIKADVRLGDVTKDNIYLPDASNTFEVDVELKIAIS